MVLAVVERLPLVKDIYRLKDRITELSVTELNEPINTLVREANELKNLHPRRLGGGELDLEGKIIIFHSTTLQALIDISEKLRLITELRRIQETQDEEHVTSVINEVKERIENLVSDVKKLKEEFRERYEEGIKEMQKKINAKISLYSNDPAREFFMAGLAKLQENQSNYYHILERYEESAKSAVASIESRKMVLTKDPDTHNPLLADSYYGLSLCYAELKQFENAAESMQHAVDIRTSLAENNAEEYSSLLGHAHYELAFYYSELGRYEEALKSSQKTVDIRTILAAQDPDTFNASLASAHHDHACNLDELERYEEAIESARLVLEIRQGLAAREPESSVGELAVAQHNVAFYLNRVGKFTEALPYVKEAVVLERRRAEEEHDVPAVNLAHSLRLLSYTHMRLADYPAAEACITECTAIFRKSIDVKTAAKDSIEDSLRGYGRALEVYSELLEETERKEEALATAQEAITVLEKCSGILAPRVIQSLTSAKSRVERLGPKDGQRQDKET